MLLLNNQPIESFLFSGGEHQIKLPKDIKTERVVLTWKPTSSCHITWLMLTVNALKHAGISDIDLDILYLPYARQDRVCAPGEAFSLEVICNMLDNLDVTFIRFWDVHNGEVTDTLLNHGSHCYIDAVDIFARYKILDDFDLDNLILCAPDDGACERVNDIVDKFELGFPVVMKKERCFVTGKIIGMKPNQYSRTGKGYNILIIDDICDGGATFLQAAEVLKSQGAVDLFLYVTHGIFSKGLEELQSTFKHIYCHHVLHDDKYQSNDFLTILQEYPSVR